MIYVTGDTHGSIDIHKLNTKNLQKQNINMTKDDYLIICGDFGLVWDNSKSDLYWRKWLNNKPWTTLVVDGNHENFDLLYQFPIENKFNGKVRRIEDKIYHLQRGEIYTIEGKKIFAFGGANSHDKVHRKEGINWWKQEKPTIQEMSYGIDNLMRHNWNIDCIITHTCSYSHMPLLTHDINGDIELERYFNFIKNELDSNHINYKWYFGHFHQDLKIGNRCECLYNKIKLI